MSQSNDGSYQESVTQPPAPVWRPHSTTDGSVSVYVAAPPPLP
jgi:hypothetical protein